MAPNEQPFTSSLFWTLVRVGKRVFLPHFYSRDFQRTEGSFTPQSTVSLPRCSIPFPNLTKETPFFWFYGFQSPADLDQTMQVFLFNGHLCLGVGDGVELYRSFTLSPWASFFDLFAGAINLFLFSNWAPNPFFFEVVLPTGGPFSPINHAPPLKHSKNHHTLVPLTNVDNLFLFLIELTFLRKVPTHFGQPCFLVSNLIQMRSRAPGMPPTPLLSLEGLWFPFPPNHKHTLSRRDGRRFFLTPATLVRPHPPRVLQRESLPQYCLKRVCLSNSTYFPL